MAAPTSLRRTTAPRDPSRGPSIRGRRRRRLTAAERAKEARRLEQRRRMTLWGGMGAVIIAVSAVAIVATRDGGSPPSTSKPGVAAPVVGGDLHTLAMVGNALYVGGHAATAVSRDGGRQWQQVPSLDDADAMGWAVTPDAVLVGGHPGLFRSNDKGTTFTRVSGGGALTDVHALGGSGATVYAGSPQAGLLISTDGGRTWAVRNAEAGRSFMGTILADPRNPARLIAPDMTAGLTTSSDGGRTWRTLGGPTDAMAVAWNPRNIRELLAVGMGGGARSTDGGASWQQVDLPRGTSAVSYDSSGRKMYAGALDGDRARTYRSIDGGASWIPTE